MSVNIINKFDDKLIATENSHSFGTVDDTPVGDQKVVTDEEVLRVKCFDDTETHTQWTVSDENIQRSDFTDNCLFADTDTRRPITTVNQMSNTAPIDQLTTNCCQLSSGINESIHCHTIDDTLNEW